MNTYNKFSAHGNFYCIFQNPKMYLSKEQRIFVVTSYLRTGSFKLVQQDFELRFPERASPTKKTINYGQMLISSKLKKQLRI